MDRIKTILTIVAVAGMFSATSANAQTTATITDECNTCGSSWNSRPRYFMTGNRPSWMISKSEWHSYKHHAEIARQRNEAWPKPFQCHDRQVYFATFYPMYQRGYEIETTLTDSHFKNDTNELNSAGKRKVASIMHNLPIKRRHIYVFESGDAEMTQSRVANVRVAINEWFGHMQPPKIATTQNQVYYQSGVEVQQLNSSFLSSLPSPGIAAGSSGGGGGGEGGGN